MKMIMSVLGMLLLTVTAFAGFQGFNGSANLGVFNKVKCGSGFDCAKEADKLLIGSGLFKQVVASTAVILKSQCGSSFVSGVAAVMTLPEASTVLGCRITFIGGSANDLDINPSGVADQIYPITASGGTISPAAGDAIRLTDFGASVTLEAVGADAWAAVSHNGAITDVN